VLGDKGFVSEPLAQDLANNNNLKLLTLPKSNQKKKVPKQLQWLHNLFRQIELLG
jgi:hypothetical protein